MSSADVGRDVPTGISGQTFTASEVSDALEKMLVSPSFARSPRLQAFLRYIVEVRLSGREDSPKEYELGTRIFDRPTHFVPQTDPIVRVQARQLRFKLREYYESDGAADRVRIDLPKGTYLPTFIDQATPAATVAAETKAGDGSGPNKWRGTRWLIWLLVAGALPLLLLALRKQIAPPPVVPYRPTASAHALYLAGRYNWNQRKPQSLKKAVDDFAQATAQDPNYAQAYAGLADAYNLLPEYSAMPPNEAYAHAIKAAERAIELDDASAEAHSALAFDLFWARWDAAASEREFHRAILLDPRYARAHHWYANTLHAEGRFTDALAEMEKARELDPTSSSILADYGLLLFSLGRRNEAMNQLHELEADEPTSLSPHRYLAELCGCTGDARGLLQELKQQATFSNDPSIETISSAARSGFAVGGEKAMFQKLLDAQKRAYEEGHASAFDLAQTSALGGRPEQAIHYLQVSFQRHDSEMMAMPSDCSLQSLHGDASFKQLLARLRDAERSEEPSASR